MLGTLRLATVGQNHRTQSLLPNKVLDVSRCLLRVSLFYHHEVIKHDKSNHRELGTTRRCVRVKCNPAWQETIPVEKAAEHRPLDSPSKRRTLLLNLNLTAGKKQKAGNLPTPREVNVEAARGYLGFAHTLTPAGKAARRQPLSRGASQRTSEQRAFAQDEVAEMNS